MAPEKGYAYFSLRLSLTSYREERILQPAMTSSCLLPLTQDPKAKLVPKQWLRRQIKKMFSTLVSISCHLDKP